MSVKSFVGRIWSGHRARQISRQADQALALQAQTFSYLIHRGRKTAFGKAHGFEDIREVKDFQARVPVRSYEQNREWFDRIYKAEPNACWPGLPLYFAKTSGTTAGAKYIPITRESIAKQILGARDALMLYIAATSNATFLDGKMMFLSGSPELDRNPYGLATGRLSGIVNHYVPAYLTRNRVPAYDTNVIEDWEEKVVRIVDEVAPQDLRLISGIPPWVQMLFEVLEDRTGRSPMEVWPNLSLFVQGGVEFKPYKPIFDRYLGEKVDIVEVFPASEGFFAVQDRREDDGLLLMPDYGIFFEFIPLEKYGQPDAPRLTMAEVELNQQYALVVSTNAGLWAYDIGDVVKFVSLNPWRIRVTGRVKHFISAFGEHVIAEEVNQAILDATRETGAKFQEFTVAPLISDTKGESAHEWLIEFVSEPQSLEQFTEALDQAMRRQNPYYEDLRAGNILRRAVVRPLQLNASRAYMKAQGKLGGQNKFPRLSNNREIADQLYEYLAKPR